MKTVVSIRLEIESEKPVPLSAIASSISLRTFYLEEEHEPLVQPFVIRRFNLVDFDPNQLNTLTVMFNNYLLNFQRCRESHIDEHYTDIAKAMADPKQEVAEAHHDWDSIVHPHGIPYYDPSI